MRKLFLLTCACLLFVAHASPVPGQGTDELRLSVGLTTGERGRDSNSQTTSLTVEGNSIVWQQTFGGRRRGTPPSRKQFALSSADKAGLLKLIRSNNLLVTDSIELSLDPPVFYFRISVDLTLDGEKGAINISGPKTAVKVKEEKLYQNTLTLVKELYRIMHGQDKTVVFEELIREPIRRSAKRSGTPSSDEVSTGSGSDRVVVGIPPQPLAATTSSTPVSPSSL